MKNPDPPRLRVAVLGAGSWGTALAAAASRRHATVLWARDAAQAGGMAATHENARYLPGISLPQALNVSSDLDATLRSLQEPGARRLIVLGVPVAGLTAICDELSRRLPALGLQDTPIVWTCKGFEADTARLPHEIMREALPGAVGGALSGPSFAREVAQGLPVALTVASDSPALREATTAAFHGAALRVYASTDLVGVGDLVLTATGELSRNRRVGLEIGAGRKLADILASGITAEGVRCARAALERARAIGVELPITEAVCAVLFDGVAPMTAVSALLARDARYESGIASQPDASPDNRPR